MNDIAKKINQEIKDKDIKPRSKKYFVLKQIIIWILFGWALLLISLAIALGWEISVQQDYRLMLALPDRFLFIIQTLPYFWIVLAIVLAVIALVEFKGTNKGYKLQWYFILLGLIILNFILAGIFYFTGVAQYIENKLESHIPGYHRVVPVPQKMWLEPEDGLLSGIIIETEDVPPMRDPADGWKIIILEDWDENEWEVVIEEDTMMPPFLELTEDEAIRIIGEAIDENEFRAFGIKPWQKGFKGRGKLFEGKRLNQREINNLEPAYY